ncbi:ubiquinol--cytochrome-c reductase subunit COR1 [Ascoidea rubescens DSM 1968]|uniref:LuxS/MPP-like metallohydrolase n=1 Tax=Ascoidea rubescens DSM 1968 TaxID=1344418 RepID=A0A1D2VRP8_9ASCO|nr:LuxS/MPP-like metallohydrolase [Ascoidea rubescens DSM 1968]ODV64292.1 LuxS/MPP-like metallohydrolase [Ascoidea rubescens DSM 1968]
MISRSNCLNAFRTASRYYSTSIIKPKYTSLPSGLTIATQSDPNAKSSAIGLYFGTGSKYENPYNNGVSSLIGNYFVNLNQNDAAKFGSILSFENSRESTGIISQSINPEQSLSQLASFFNSPDFDSSLVQSQAKLASKNAEIFESNYPKMVLEHLHSVAFQNSSLALPVNGTSDTLSTLQSSDLEKFFKKNYFASNAVVVGAGNIAHETLVELAEKHFSLKEGLPEQPKPASFLGSEVRMRDDTLPKAYIAIAAEGPAIDSPDYYTALVASSVFGSYLYSEPFYHNSGVKLASILTEYHVADSYDHFSLSYKDSGLWGFVTETANIGNIDDLIHFTLKEWNRLSISLTETEVERAKAHLSTKLFNQFNSPKNTASIIGKDIASGGRTATTAQIQHNIDAVSLSKIKNWAQDALYDKDIAISGTGQIEALLEYSRIRADMSMMRW